MSRLVVRLVLLLLCAALTGAVAPTFAQADTAEGDPQIEARWQELGGADGELGGPSATKPEPYDAAGGRAREFEHGHIYWSQATGAWEVRAAILERYLALGGPGGALGLPTAAARELSAAGALEQEFAAGRLYWSEATGARALSGRVLARYLALGGPQGRLGLPSSEPLAVGTGTETVFARGRIYDSEATGTRAVWGPILARYLSVGGAAGRLGLPMSEEASVPGGRRSTFQGGHIYWSSRTGAHPVWGAILSRYLAIGASASYLGMPTSSEYRITGGWRGKFTGGYISWYSGKGSAITGIWRPYVQTVTAAQIPYSYRSGCPVGPAGLRLVKMPYYDFAGVPRYGDLVVRTSAADDMQRVFKRAFDARFPVRRMVKVDVYRADDVRSMAADNTSAFNCRKVTGNPYRLSQHSYGNAIDINPFENPYVTASRVYPSGSSTYLDRRNVRKGMILGSGAVARGMAAEGWPWGARWAHPDYQHFSSNGG